MIYIFFSLFKIKITINSKFYSSSISSSSFSSPLSFSSLSTFLESFFPFFCFFPFGAIFVDAGSAA